MAMLDEMFCPTCQKTVEVAVICGRYPNECGECSEKRKKKEKEKTLAELERLPLEIRLSRIEEKLYDMEHQPLQSDIMG